MEFFGAFLPVLLTGAELIFSLFVAVWNFDEKPNFSLRLSLSASAVAAVAVLFACLSYFFPSLSPLFSGVGYVALALASLVAAIVCFHLSFFAASFCAAIAFSAVLCSSELARLVVFLAAYNGAELGVWWAVLLRVVLSSGAIVLARVAFSRRLGGVERLADKLSLAVFISLVATSAVLVGAGEFLSVGSSSLSGYLFGVGVVYALATLFGGYVYLFQRQSDEQLSVVKSLWEADRKNYEMQKENAEAISIKAHDLHHRLENAKRGEKLGADAMKDIEDTLSEYDSVVETGNEVLDVILSNFTHRCHEGEVMFTSMVDGEQLSFMQEMDLYSLFCNMLENAYEYEQTVYPTSNRFISVTVKKMVGVISLHAENYFAGELALKDGVAQTSKKDKQNHGFGMKSMKKIVEKYHGEMNVSVADEMFQIDVLLPLDGKGGSV